jgi:transcriptional regulator with XRE-family HTH domain
MTKVEVIEKLKHLRKEGIATRAQVARETGLKEMWLYALETGRMKDPGSTKFDTLRHYLLSLDVKLGRLQ